MKKQLFRIMVVAAGLTLLVAAAALAQPKVVRVGNLFFKDDGGISPARLPRHEAVPVSAIIKDEIGTLDGSHPPAIESVVAYFDKTIQVNATGLPVCRKSQIVARSTTSAKQACPDAIVGSGKGEVEVAFPEQAPFSAKGPIVLFNGGVQGGTTLLLIHAYVAVPAPTAVIATVKITRVHRGPFGLHVVAEIPKIAGGFGSPLGYRITLGRTFTYKGKRQSYLSASCPTGHYLAEGRIQFFDGTLLKLSHALPCTPAGS
jgi:hypothetical protein